MEWLTKITSVEVASHLKQLEHDFYMAIYILLGNLTIENGKLKKKYDENLVAIVFKIPKLTWNMKFNKSQI